MLRNLQRLTQRKAQLSADSQPCQQWFPSFPLHCCVSGCFLWGLQKHTLQEVKPHVTQMRSLSPPPLSLDLGDWKVLSSELGSRVLGTNTEMGPVPDTRNSERGKRRRGRERALTTAHVPVLLCYKELDCSL